MQHFDHVHEVPTTPPRSSFHNITDLKNKVHPSKYQAWSKTRLCVEPWTSSMCRPKYRLPRPWLPPIYARAPSPPLDATTQKPSSPENYRAPHNLHAAAFNVNRNTTQDVLLMAAERGRKVVRTLSCGLQANRTSSDMTVFVGRQKAVF